MPGFTRRSKPLKGSIALSDITNFSLSNPSDDDLIAFDSGTGLWVNTKSLGGDYVVAGSFQSSTLVVDGLTTIGGEANITGGLDVGGNGEVDGTFIIGGAASLLSTLSVTGTATFLSSLTATGLLSGAGFSMSGNGQVDGNLTVAGTVTAGTLALSSLTVGDLTATAIIAETLTASGAVNAASFSASGGIAGVDGAFSGTMDASQYNIGGGFAEITHDGTDLDFTNLEEDGTVIIGGFESSGSTAVTMLSADPLAGVDLYFANALRVSYTDTQYDLSAFTGSLKLPIGTNAQEPANAAGQIRWNTDEAALEVNDGSAWAALAGGGGGGDVVDDTSPQLGGDLDVNGNDIVSLANATISILPNGTGNVALGTMVFDADQTIGAGQDNYVLTYDNSTGFISLEASAGGGSSLTKFVDDGLAGDMLYDATVVASTHGSGLRIDNANPFYAWHNVAGTRLAYAQNNVTNGHLIIQNEVHGDNIVFQTEQAGGTVVKNIEMDPDGAVTLYHDGDDVVNTSAAGIQVRSAAGTFPQVQFMSGVGSGTNAGFVFYDTTDDRMTIRSSINSDHVVIRAHTAAGTQQMQIQCDPDVGVGLYQNDVEVARSVAASSGGLEVNNTSTGSGFERVLTTSDAGGGSSLSQFQDNSLVGEALYDSTVVFSTTTTGIDINPISTTNAVIQGRTAAGAQEGQVQFNNSTYGMLMYNQQVSGIMSFLGEDSGSALTTMAQMDPNGSVDLYHNGDKKLGTASTGIEVFPLTGNNSVVQLKSASSVNQAQIQANNGTYGALFYSQVNSNHISLLGTTSGSALKLMLDLDPDTGVGFNGTTAVAKPTVTGSRGGNAALASLLTALANMGLITDSSS